MIVSDIQKELEEKQRSILQLADEVKHAFQKHADDEGTIVAQAAATAGLQSNLQHAEDSHNNLTHKLDDLTSQMQLQTDALQSARDEHASTKQQLELACQAKVHPE